MKTNFVFLSYHTINAPRLLYSSTSLHHFTSLPNTLELCFPSFFFSSSFLLVFSGLKLISRIWLYVLEDHLLLQRVCVSIIR